MLRASAGLIALLVSAPLTDLPARPVCRDAPDCNVAGTRALGSGQMAAAEAAFKAQVCFAWRGGDTAEIVLAHNNLALLALRRGEPLQARLWADLALKFDSRSPAALYNARLAAERAARLPPAQGVTGTYWCRWGDSLGHELEVQELPGKRIRFELQATHILSASACDARDFNMGGAFGHAALTGRVAVWETQEWAGPCRLGFSFGPDELTLTQDGSAQDCGFGGNVHADGTYRRTSRQPPHFTPGDSTMAVWKDVCDEGGITIEDHTLRFTAKAVSTGPGSGVPWRDLHERPRTFGVKPEDRATTVATRVGRAVRNRGDALAGELDDQAR